MGEMALFEARMLRAHAPITLCYKSMTGGFLVSVVLEWMRFGRYGQALRRSAGRGRSLLGAGYET